MCLHRTSGLGGALAAECGAGLPRTGALRVTGSPVPAWPERRSLPGRLPCCPGRGLVWRGVRPSFWLSGWRGAGKCVCRPQLKAIHPLKQRRASEQPGWPAWGPRGRRRPYSCSEWIACLLQLALRMQAFFSLQTSVGGVGQARERRRRAGAQQMLQRGDGRAADSAWASVGQRAGVGRDGRV